MADTSVSIAGGYRRCARPGLPQRQRLLHRCGCRPQEAEELARSLLARGRADAPAGHVVRMVAFGSAAETDDARRWHPVPIAHVVAFLRGYLREHWGVLKHAQIKDPTLGILALLEKFGA